jgi:hypothetical protein
MCSDRVSLLVYQIGRYAAHYGTMPYAAGEGAFVDPLVLLSDPPDCPELSEWQGGELVDSGYRMPNWDDETWTRVFRLASMPQGLLRAQRPDGSEGLFKGLPLVWCAEPAHFGQRIVSVLAHPPPNGSIRNGLPSGHELRMTEPVFNAHMQTVEKLLAEGD